MKQSFSPSPHMHPLVQTDQHRFFVSSLPKFSGTGEFFGGFSSINTSVNDSDINASTPIPGCTCCTLNFIIVLDFNALFLHTKK